MVHFVPLQKRGSSNSPYSIYDQLSIDDDVFDIKCSEHVKRKMLKQVLEIMRTDLGILSVTDVVWNHTAHNSEWLQEHPEAGNFFFYIIEYINMYNFELIFFFILLNIYMCNFELIFEI